MRMRIDKIAITLMEALAATIFLLALVFLGESRKISSKLEELEESSLRACKMGAYGQIRKRRKSSSLYAIWE